MHRLRFIALACAALACLPAVATAQDPAPDQQARVHLGPLSFTPTIIIENVGVDTNASNDAVNPVRDFTGTVGPGVDAWFRYGRLLVSDKTAFEWLYFKKLTKQRAADLTQDERVDVSFAYFTPHVGADFTRSRQRPSLDLDTRVRRTAKAVNGGVEFHFGPRTGLDVIAEERHETTDHDLFEGVDLGNELTRDTSQKELTFTRALTPLTTFQIQAATQRVRFPFDALRNNDSNMVMAGFSLKPLALVSGDLLVGVRLFNPLSPLVPDYQGLIAKADATYVLNDMLQLKSAFTRDVDYSFDPQSPYFLSTTAGVTATQSLGTFWDVRGRFTYSSLAYRAFATGPDVVVGAAHTDHGTAVGAGLGRHLVNGIRIGVDVDHVNRTSTIEARRFGGFRIGGSFTYGGS